MAPELRVERERSQLVVEELMGVVLGKEYMEMKHEMGKRSVNTALQRILGRAFCNTNRSENNIFLLL